MSCSPATHGPARCGGRRLDPDPGAYTRIGDADVILIKPQSILVIALLLPLLLQLPRLDDPPEVRLVGGEISRVEDIRGAALYVDMGTGGIALVFVSELLMHQDPSGRPTSPNSKGRSLNEVANGFTSTPLSGPPRSVGVP